MQQSWQHPSQRCSCTRLCVYRQSAVHQLVLHPALTSSLKVGSTTVGRDKLYRTIQYLARFLAFCQCNLQHIAIPSTLSREY